MHAAKSPSGEHFGGLRNRKRQPCERPLIGPLNELLSKLIMEFRAAKLLSSLSANKPLSQMFIFSLESPTKRKALSLSKTSPSLFLFLFLFLLQKSGSTSQASEPSGLLFSQASRRHPSKRRLAGWRPQSAKLAAPSNLLCLLDWQTKLTISFAGSAIYILANKGGAKLDGSRLGRRMR